MVTAELLDEIAGRTARRSRVPWRAKLWGKLLLAQLPLRYELWQRLGLFRQGSMENGDYAIAVFDLHLARAGLTEIRGQTILELGPGDSIATAMVAAARGARAILVDSASYARHDVGPYRALAQLLKDRQPGFDISACTTVDQILKRCDAIYLTGGVGSLQALPSGSVDFMFSHAVLEHVRKRDFSEMQRQCRRILRPTGVASHQIDLRDHLDGALNNLRFGSGFWESEWFANSSLYNNRLSFKQVCEAFREAGFVIEIGNVHRWESLPTPKEKMSTEFADRSKDELLIRGFDVVLR